MLKIVGGVILLLAFCGQVRAENEEDGAILNILTEFAVPISAHYELRLATSSQGYIVAPFDGDVDLDIDVASDGQFNLHNHRINADFTVRSA